MDLPPYPDQDLGEISAPIVLTISLRGTVFSLSKAQIDFDSPNLFVDALRREGADKLDTRSIRFDRNPTLFAIILEWLSGYEILPLPMTAIPNTMTADVALRNLATDAKFYRLERLQRHLEQAIFARAPQFDLSWTVFGAPIVKFEDVIHSRLPRSASWTQQGLCDTSTSTPDYTRRILVAAEARPFWIVASQQSSGASINLGIGLTQPEKAKLQRLRTVAFKENAIFGNFVVWEFPDQKVDSILEIDGILCPINVLKQEAWRDVALQNRSPPYTRFMNHRFSGSGVRSFPLWGDKIFLEIKMVNGKLCPHFVSVQCRTLYKVLEELPSGAVASNVSSGLLAEMSAMYLGI